MNNCTYLQQNNWSNFEIVSKCFFVKLSLKYWGKNNTSQYIAMSQLYT